MSGDAETVCRCGQGNPAGSRFCGRCGESLAVECLGCGTALPADARFCHQCGKPVVTTTQDVIALPEHMAWKIDASRTALEGERKQITVLFADVRGSMDLAERLDPESWRELMHRIYQVLADAVHHADGTVDKFTGDGIMALFGAPIAREDHAQCACRAAVEMLAAVDRLADEVRGEGVDLAVRIGINSGEVVVGSIGDEGEMEYTAVGHTVGLAQRMESLADAGTACLTARTAALVEGHFDLADLGDRAVKGASSPIRVFRVERALSGPRGRGGSPSRGLSQFVGRAAEVAELEAAFERSQSGAGEVIGIVAPAGVGKSRLCQEFAHRCRDRGIRVYEARCESHLQKVPLGPVLDLMRSRFGITATDTDAEAQAKIIDELSALEPGDGTAEDLDLVFDFLGVRAPDAPPIAMAGDARNRRLRDLVRQIVQATNRDPSVVIIEDLHWIDAASEVFLETLIDAIPASGGIVVANFRPEYRATWMTSSHYHQIPLTTLSTESLESLLAELLGPNPSLDGLAELIAERTAGNPFYVEEIVRELAGSGTLEGERGAYRMAREIDGLPVPPTVQAILAARIDRLSPEAKVVLQAGAAIGLETSRELLGTVVDLDPGTLDTAIQSLTDNEFLYQTAFYPTEILTFRHPLTQEVAYGSQLAAARNRAHTAIAMALQTTDGDRVDENAGLIAQHFERAGDAMHAAEWHLRALTWSGLRDPMASIRHALQVVDLDDRLPDGPDGDMTRLTARLYVATMGWRVGADVTVIRRAYEEGIPIAERLGDPTLVALLHTAFGGCPVTCEGDVDEGLSIALKGVELADQIGDPGLMVLTKTFPAYCHWLQGRLTDCLELTEEVLELTSRDVEVPFKELLGDPRAWALMARGACWVVMGREADGRQSIEEAIALAEESSQETLGWAHMFAATVHLVGGPMSDDELIAHVEAAFAIAERLGDAFSRTWAQAWVGYGALVAGDAERAIDDLTRALSDVDRRGAGREARPIILRGLGAAMIQAGDVDRGIDVLHEGVSMAIDLRIPWAELWTRELLGTALIDRNADDDREKASDQFARALDIARAMGAVPAERRISGELEIISSRT